MRLSRKLYTLFEKVTGVLQGINDYNSISLLRATNTKVEERLINSQGWQLKADNGRNWREQFCPFNYT